MSPRQTEEDPMADNRTAKAVASKVNNGKKAQPRDRALRRAAKTLEKASARQKKAQGNLDAGNTHLDAALLALEKTDAGSPKAREVEAAARAALKELLVQRKKLRRAQRALRRAEAKEQKAKDRAAVAAAREARAEEPAARTRKASKKRPVKRRTKGQATTPPKSATTKPNVEKMPAAKSDSAADSGGFQESAGAPHLDLR